MPRRRSKPLPSERHLFLVEQTGEPRAGQISQTWQDAERSPAARLADLAGGNIGPHSNIIERAERLITVMNNLASRNMLESFLYASRDRKYKKPIWERYLDGTSRIINNSASKVDRLDDEITFGLVALSGYDKVKGMSLLTTGEVRTKIDKNDKDFEDLYGPPIRISGARNSYRGVQKRFLPKGHPLRQKKKKQLKQAHERIAA